jgi:hypothetical protein
LFIRINTKSDISTMHELTGQTGKGGAEPGQPARVLPSGQVCRPLKPNFRRDVWINVLANLIATAIVYLLLQATGYIRVNPALTAIALAFVLPGVLSVVLALFSFLKYFFSGGDSGNIASAKNTSIYAALFLLVGGLFWVSARIGSWLSGAGSMPHALAIELGVLSFSTVGVAEALRQFGMINVDRLAIRALLVVLIILTLGCALGFLFPSMTSIGSFLL